MNTGMIISFRRISRGRIFSVMGVISRIGLNMVSSYLLTMDYEVQMLIQ